MELKNLVKGKKYRIKGESKYFKEKYGTCNPEFRYEDIDTNIWGKCWADITGNPTTMLFAMRAGMELLAFDVDETRVCYGHIHFGNNCWLGELVHPDELEEINE